MKNYRLLPIIVLFVIGLFSCSKAAPENITTNHLTKADGLPHWPDIYFAINSTKSTTYYLGENLTFVDYDVILDGHWWDPEGKFDPDALPTDILVEGMSSGSSVRISYVGPDFGPLFQGYRAYTVFITMGRIPYQGTFDLELHIGVGPE